ncbi:hypothetical protein MASR1M66_15630 [Aminivibrio sp.]
MASGSSLPASVPLVGILMFGNLLRECGVTERLSLAAQNEILSATTIFLGLSVGATMNAEKFLTVATIKIILLRGLSPSSSALPKCSSASFSRNGAEGRSTP